MFVRRAPAVAMAIALASATPLLLGAARAPSVVIDDRVLIAQPPPLVQGGRVLLPMRAVFQALGATVQYDGAHHAVVAKRGGREVFLPIGATFAFVGGRRVDLDVGSVVREGRAFVPLRFVAQALGASVDYVAGANQVVIRLPGALDVSDLQTPLPMATPVPPALPYAPVPLVPAVPNPTPYPDDSRGAYFPFLPAYAAQSNGLFFGLVGEPNGWGYFTIPGVEGRFPLTPWPGVPGRYYGVADVPLSIAAPWIVVYGRFYVPGGDSVPFSLSVPVGTGQVAPILVTIPAPHPRPRPRPKPHHTPAPHHTPPPRFRLPGAPATAAPPPKPLPSAQLRRPL